MELVMFTEGRTKMLLAFLSLFAIKSE